MQKNRAGGVGQGGQPRAARRRTPPRGTAPAPGAPPALRCSRGRSAGPNLRTTQMKIQITNPNVFHLLTIKNNIYNCSSHRDSHDAKLAGQNFTAVLFSVSVAGGKRELLKKHVSIDNVGFCMADVLIPLS